MLIIPIRSLSYMWSDYRTGMINPSVKLELVSQHTKIQASAPQTFVDVFVEAYLRVVLKLILDIMRKF